MKTIGLIGGMSWESSIEYYRLINKITKKRLGGLNSAKIIMYSVNFAPIEKWMREGQWDLIQQELIHASKVLEEAGADFILICTNTMHKLIDQMQDSIQIPIYHIADATAYKIKSLGLQKVGLLGTRFTMEGDFYRTRLKDHHGIDVIIPSKEDRAVVDSIIFQELVVGSFTDASRTQYKRIITSLTSNHAEGVVLGCTEIPLLISQKDSPIPIFDTTFLHAEFAVSKALE